MVINEEYDATYHHILKFSIKLLKLGGELLQGDKNRDVSVVLRKNPLPEDADLGRVYLPRLVQSAHSRVAHPHNDGEE